jgi:hypothetical protein
MPSTNRNLLGQIIRLSKSIAIQEPLDEAGFKVQFIAKHPLLGLYVGPTVTFWNTASSFQAINSIARMIRACHSEAADCDTETIAKLIPSTIQDLVFDKTIFDSNLILTASKKTLADCRADEDIALYSNKVYDRLIERVRSSMSEWCTVLGVPRVICKSFDIPQAGITLASRMDGKKWEEVVTSRYETNSWSHLLGCSQGSSIPPIFGFECRSLVIHQAAGTQIGTKFKSRLEFAKFFALLYATVTIYEGLNLHPAGEAPYRTCIQFPSLNSSGPRIHQSQLEESVFPFFANDFTLSKEAIAAMQKWYVDLESLPADYRVKVEKSCYFINRGMITRDLDSYVNFFVSLDALFGVDRDVGGSIERRVKSLPIEESLKEKVSWLYQLRNELVHGGSRYCAEWQKYERYCSHFGTRPENDIKRVACSTVLYSTRSVNA